MLQWNVGAVDETRTRDLHLGKVALYQLSYYRISFGEGFWLSAILAIELGAGEGTRTHTPLDTRT